MVEIWRHKERNSTNLGIYIRMEREISTILGLTSGARDLFLP